MFGLKKAEKKEKKPAVEKVKRPVVAKEKGHSFLASYINNIAVKKKDLVYSLRDVGIKKNPYDFAKNMIINAMIVSVVCAVAMFVVFDTQFQTSSLSSSNPYTVTIFSAVIAALLGFVLYKVFVAKFMDFPMAKTRQMGVQIERDILFAARDIVISMRSGMPLFNAMTAVSTGYGAASKEFAKIIELIEMGTPIEQAMDEISLKSQSKTFKRILLQASVSIRAGVDITAAVQDVVAEVTAERIIDMRRYGQKLNALAMFYMLVGVIFPSMGIAVAVILTTFISIFSINLTILIAVLVGLVFLQIIFLNIMKNSRPVFTM